MAGISGINSWMYSSYTNDYGTFSGINNSTEKFKGTVTGYNPVQKTTATDTAASALTSEDTKSYLAALKDFGGKLKTATGTLFSKSDNVFSKVTGTSSKEDVLTVSATKQDDAAKFADAKSTKNVTVQQLASTQRNTGSTLNAMAINGANAGINSFAIEKDGKSYQFNVNVNRTDSVRTVQQKTADVINSNKSLGITASVQYDDKTKKSTLILAANDTGEKNAFSISDTEGKGNLIAALGADQVTQSAKDSRYTVDGMTRTSDKNTVDLGDGLTGTLKKVSAESVEVKAKKDVAGISGAVYDMVNNFNGLMETAKNFGNDKGAQALQQRLSSIATSYASSLKNIGITSNKNGYLQIDSAKLTKAFENGSAERYLGNENAGFTQRLSQLSKSIDANPEQFASYQSRSTVSTEASGAAYSNNSYANYLSAYRSAQVNNLGLLFSGAF